MLSTIKKNRPQTTLNNMSNLRTITDIQQEEVSVHSIVLIGNPTGRSFYTNFCGR